MSTATEHYENLLAEHYTWMFGLPLEKKVAEQRTLLERLGVTGKPGPNASLAIDLGCGSGFQSLALAELGFRVLAIDTSDRLLGELNKHKGSLPIQTVQEDIRHLKNLVRPGTAQVVVCMGDTLTHLPHRNDLPVLFKDMYVALATGGACVLSFRDLAAAELQGTDRFIPVHGDDQRIMTCFLEYTGSETVTVHDLVHTRKNEREWILQKSSYQKLRLSAGWIISELERAGLVIESTEQGRLVVIKARKGS